MHRERMLGYYPSVIKSIAEFNAIVDAESSEVDELDSNKELVISDAYLLTMSEQRVIQWEKKLGIQPLDQATIEDRRNGVLARIRCQGKLNTSLINTIVKTFTGQGCDCRISNGTLYIGLLPFDDSKVSLDDVITNVTNELVLKIPAHLRLNVDLAYVHWDEVSKQNNSWAMVRDNHGTWNDVLFGVHKKMNMLDTSKLDEFYLG